VFEIGDDITVLTWSAISRFRARTSREHLLDHAAAQRRPDDGGNRADRR
jgi:hypothetical protein